jgi:hypothetical protein
MAVPKPAQSSLHAGASEPCGRVAGPRRQPAVTPKPDDDHDVSGVTIGIQTLPDGSKIPSGEVIRRQRRGGAAPKARHNVCPGEV